jgi:hypothetical protein
VSGHHHGRHKRKEVPVAKPAVARPATPAASYDSGPFLTFTTKLGLVLIVILSIGLSALIAFAPEKNVKDEPAVAKVDDKEKGEKKTEKPEEKTEKKPAEKEPVEKKPPEKEPTEKKPAEKKPPEKEPMEKKPADKDKDKEKMKEKEKEKPAEKKPADKDKDKDKEKDKDKDKEKPAEKKPPEKGTDTALVFEKHVLPIFTEKCGKCHGVSGKAGVDLRTMKSILKGGANGQILTKGDLKKSLLWEVIDTEQMPQGDDKLTAEEKETIKKWIMGGAKEMAAK